MDIREILGDAYSENMTREELETALADVDVVPKATVDKDYVPKTTADKFASEAGKYRKERNARQADIESLQNSINELKRTNSVTAFTARFTAQGMDADTALSAAEAMADGDTAKFLELQEAFLKTVKEKAASDKLHNLSSPPAGGKTDSDEKDYDKLIADAQKAGNIALVIALSNQKAAAANAKH